MRKLKEVLRLHFAGLTQQQIARSCLIAQSTVHEYLKAAQAAGLSWSEVGSWDEAQLVQTLYPKKPQPEWRKNPLPDFAAIHQEVQAHKHLTLQLVWEEYRQTHPDGYGYSRFCELYGQWVRRLDLVLRHSHRAGEKMFVDWAGDTIPIYGPSQDATEPGFLFVAVMGASSYTYAEVFANQQLPNWIQAHIHALEFFGGSPELIVPDNTKTGVNKACRYEPDLNRTYCELARHYETAIVPARPYKARDKAKVESGVLLVERWILMRLRHRRLFGIEEANGAVRQLLEMLNQRPFRKRQGTRASVFAALDRSALKPLPANRFEYADWKTERVGLDYHIEVDHHFYSVPHTLVGRQVEARSTATTVEILHRGIRVASHPRSYEPDKSTTQLEHRPKSHQRYLEWTPSRLIEWGHTIGPHTAQWMEAVLATKPHPEMGFRSCMGVRNLAKDYGPERVEAACERALWWRACNLQSLRSILANRLDRVPLNRPSAVKPTPAHENIRGAAYFDLAESDPGLLQ